MKTLSIALVMLFIIPACGSTSATRETPEGTVEMFKVLHRKGDRAGEWDILSPNFKRRISRRAGRNVDVGDFEFMMNQLQQDPKVRLAETLLQTAVVTDQQQIDADTTRVTVRAGGPLGKTATLTMRRLQKWVLTVVSEDQPYWGIVGDPEINVSRGNDGSYTVQTGGVDGWSDTFAADEVEKYEILAQWYVDDLGELEQQFMAGAGGPQ